jgi:hypothetical protein
MMTNYKLHSFFKDFLRDIYKGQYVPKHLITTMAMMLTGLFLGRHVQLWQMAIWVPVNILLPSIVRRFERWVADPSVETAKLFEPFVWAMQASLGNETAYLLIDCTQAGKKCRTLMIGLAYHGTVLPIIWKTVRGNKGHVTGELHRMLLKQVYPLFRHHRRVVVLGDAEFSNEKVIGWLLQVKWDFVLRFQSSYLLQTAASDEWQSARALYQAAGLQPGRVYHWADVVFTQSHQFADLNVTTQWAEGEEEVICLVSTLPESEQPHVVYEMRYWIETLFGNHKSRGFQLTRTHMTDPEHIDRLVLVLVIATCIALGLGTHLILIQDTRQVDRADRRDLSLFQIGWRWFFRLLALDRLHELKITFSWGFELPPPGFQPAT